MARKTGKQLPDRDRAAPVVQKLNAPWKRWWDFLGREEAWAADPKLRGEIHARLLRWVPEHRGDAAWIGAVLSAVSRGKALVEAALRWAEPAAGQKTVASVTETDRARGEQWRLVMAFGGLETLVKALLGIQKGARLDPTAFDYFVEQTQPGRYEGLPSPTVREEDMETVFRPQTGTAHPLLAFLDLNWTNARSIFRWLVQGKPVETWTGALRLAKALRDATSHGALSASKVQQWKLRPALNTLTANIGQLVAQALEELAHK